MTGSRLDPWIDSYADRALGMTASEIRALFAVASRPEVVSLAGGMPYVNALPMDAIADTVRHMLLTRGDVALQYGAGQGDQTLREQILDVMAPVGVSAHPDDIVVTAGSQMALDLVTRIFCNPGDVVLVEAPSYVGALGVFRSYQVDVEHVPMDDGGLVPEALAEALQREFRAAMTESFPKTTAYTSFHLEGFITGRLFVEAARRTKESRRSGGSTPVARWAFQRCSGPRGGCRSGIARNSAGWQGAPRTSPPTCSSPSVCGCCSAAPTSRTR